MAANCSLWVCVAAATEGLNVEIGIPTGRALLIAAVAALSGYGRIRIIPRSSVLDSGHGLAFYYQKGLMMSGFVVATDSTSNLSPGPAEDSGVPVIPSVFIGAMTRILRV